MYIPLRFSSSSPKYKNICIKTQVDLAVEAAGAVAGVMAVDQQMATAVDQDMAGEVMALALMALHMDLHTALDF